MHSCLVSTYRHPSSLPCVLLKQAVQEVMGEEPTFFSPNQEGTLSDKKAKLFLMDASVDDPTSFQFDTGVILPFDFDSSESLLKKNVTDFRFYFELMPRVRMSHQNSILKPSVIIPFPLVKTPEIPDEDLSLDKPIKIFFPRLASWTEEQCKRAATGVRDTMLSVFDDLSIFEFILDIPEVNFETVAGEGITFTDLEGQYIARMVSARILISMGTIFNHEVGFCHSFMEDKYRTDLIVGGELIIDYHREPEEVISEIDNIDNFWHLLWKHKEKEEGRERVGQTFMRFLVTQARHPNGNPVYMYERALNLLKPMRSFKKSLIAEKHSFKQPKEDGSIESRDSYEVFKEKLEKVLKMA